MTRESQAYSPEVDLCELLQTMRLDEHAVSGIHICATQNSVNSSCIEKEKRKWFAARSRLSDIPKSTRRGHGHVNRKHSSRRSTKLKSSGTGPNSGLSLSRYRATLRMRFPPHHPSPARGIRNDQRRIPRSHLYTPRNLLLLPGRSPRLCSGLWRDCVYAGEEGLEGGS